MATWTTPRTWTDGEKIPASTWDAHTSDLFECLPSDAEWTDLELGVSSGRWSPADLGWPKARIARRGGTVCLQGMMALTSSVAGTMVATWTDPKFDPYGRMHVVCPATTGEIVLNVVAGSGRGIFVDYLVSGAVSWVPINLTWAAVL